MSNIELCDYIESLRNELQRAIDQGEGKDLRFATEKIDLEISVSVERSADGNAGAKFRFFVFDATAVGGGKVGNRTAQTLKLSLAPVYKGRRGADFFISNETGSKPRPGY